MFHLLSSLMLGFAPGFFWLWYFYRKDEVEPEPRHLVILTFVFGCAAAGIQYLIRPWIDELAPVGWSFPWFELLDAFVLTAATEEGIKWIAFVVLILHHRELNEPLDGIVYGIAVGLGFASIENALYILTFDDWTLSPIRGFTSTLVHVACSGAACFFTGLIRFDIADGRRILLVVVGLSMAIFFHGAYDFFLVAGNNMAGPFSYLSILLALPLMLLALHFKLQWARARSKAYHGMPRYVSKLFRRR